MVKIIIQIISLVRKHLVTSILVVCAIIGTVYTVKTYYVTLRSLFLSQEPTKTSTTNPPGKENNKNPIKRDTNNSIHKKPAINPDLKPHTNIVQTMKDSPNSLQIGINNAPLTVNSVPPPKPFPERLSNLLNDINPQILIALKQGNTKFKLMVLEQQYAELQRLSSEADANKYITIDHSVLAGEQLSA